MKIDALTVCINYSDYFQHVVHNAKEFDTFTVITIPEDEDTIQVCQANEINYCFTSRIFEGGPFCKGKAINDGLEQINPQDWVCLLDADTYLLPGTIEKLKQKERFNIDCLYCLYGRYQVNSLKELEELFRIGKINKDDLEHVGLMVGYFQMWHSSMRKLYPEESPHAGLDDLLMRDSYHQDNRKILPAYTLHLGPLWKNHKGRVTSVFE